MPLLASTSLWAPSAASLVSALPADLLATSSIFPGQWVTEGEQVTVNLWLQQANGTLVEVSGIILTLRLPDHTVVNCQTTAQSGIPTVQHTANSGLWTLVFSASQPGMYQYSWTLGGAYLWSGFLAASQHAAP